MNSTQYIRELEAKQEKEIEQLKHKLMKEIKRGKEESYRSWLSKVSYEWEKQRRKILFK